MSASVDPRHEMPAETLSQECEQAVLVCVFELREEISHLDGDVQHAVECALRSALGHGYRIGCRDDRTAASVAATVAAPRGT